MKMASPFFRGGRGRFERGLMVPGAVWAVATSMWAVAVFMWAVTSSI